MTTPADSVPREIPNEIPVSDNGVGPLARKLATVTPISRRLEEADERDPGSESQGIYTYTELMNAPVEPLRFLLEGLMVEGQLTFLAGPFAIGKTMLSLQFSQHLAMGRNFMGRQVRRPYKVAFIDTENGLAEMKSRLQSQSAALNLTQAESALLAGNWLYIDTDSPGRLQYVKLDKTRFSKVKKFVQEGEVEVLVFDNFGRLFPGKETDDDKLKDFFNELKRLQNDCRTLHVTGHAYCPLRGQ